MIHLGLRAGRYMTAPVHSIDVDAKLAEAEERLRQHAISCLAVLAHGELVAVLSRTDLLRVAGRPATAAMATASGCLLALPELSVREALLPTSAGETLHQGPLCIGPGEPIAAAARLMLQHHVHRVFVVEKRRPVGVLGTTGVTRAVRDSLARNAVASAMSSPVLTIAPETPAREAVDLLGSAHVHGLLVVEGGWPVGLFGQAEALRARQEPPETPVSRLLRVGFLCLPPETPAHAAAEQLIAARATVALVMEDSAVRGILTGIDMAALSV